MASTKLNKETLTQEVLAHLSALNRFAFSLCQSRDEAEELVADTVVKAFENRQQLREKEKVKQWLFRILNNVFISHYRKEKTHQRIDLPDRDGSSFSLFEQVSNSNFTDDGTPEKSFISKITKEKIHQAINELPDEFRTTLILCDIEGFPYAEIAAITQVALGTVRSRIARARSSLQKKLWIYAGDMGITSKQKDKEHVCTCGKEETKKGNTVAV